MTVHEIRVRYEADGNVEAAIEGFTQIIDTPSVSVQDADEALTERGLLYWKLGRRADAINDYNKAIALNPASRAVQVKEATYEILNFYNKDLYNP